MPLPRITRRRFLATLGLGVAGAAGVVGYTFEVEPHWVRVARRPLPVEGLPEGLVGRTLLQISDLHIGPIVDPRFLIRSLDRAARLDPDMVVVTGDITEAHWPEAIRSAGRVLPHLPKAPLGVYAILGNHDYGIGWSNEALAEEVACVLRDSGATVLRNEAVKTGGLQIVGFDDLWSPRWAGSDVMARRDRLAPTIALCHNPDACDLDIWGDYRGWILAGHTHGGQCKPPFLPPPQLPVKNRRYTRGEFDVGPGRRLYISPGLGYLRRMRFNVRPELTLFTLEAA